MADIRRPIFAGGVICDLVTPFNGPDLDDVAFTHLIDWQIASGVSGLLACGPTSEAWALSDAERVAALRLTVAAARGRVPVIAGTGTNSTETTIVRTAEARALGASAAYIVMPYYSKPSQDGLFRHYEAVVHSVDLPVFVGLHPSRTATDLSVRTLEKLAALPRIAGIVDATGDITRMATLPAALRARFEFVSGRDLTAFAFHLSGGTATLSAAANLVPRLTVALHEALDTCNLHAAQALQERLAPVFHVLDGDEATAAIKYGLCLLRGMNDDVRLPLTPVSPETGAAIRRALGHVLCTPADDPSTRKRSAEERRHAANTS